MRKGEHDTALFGWMSDNGDPDNFADVLLGCDSIKPDLTPRAGAIKSIIRWLKGETGEQTGRARRALPAVTRDFLPAGSLDSHGKR